MVFLGIGVLNLGCAGKAWPRPKSPLKMSASSWSLEVAVPGPNIGITVGKLSTTGLEELFSPIGMAAIEING
jgi:hypothetical protein